MSVAGHCRAADASRGAARASDTALIPVRTGPCASGQTDPRSLALVAPRRTDPALCTHRIAIRSASQVPARAMRDSLTSPISPHGIERRSASASASVSASPAASEGDQNSGLAALRSWPADISGRSAPML
jgi:hypothetical protein